MGLDPDSDVGVNTPLDPLEVYSKIDSPPEIDVKLWQAHGKIIHLAIRARPDLVHSVSVLGRYVHNPSEKLWNAYSSIAPTGADVLMIENLQASISSFCSAQQSAGK